MSPSDIMSQREIDRFLSRSKVPLELGTIDGHGDPVIHPLWFYYSKGRLYTITASDSRKLKNARNNSRVYFCVDTETRPYKGVKEKATLKIVRDPGKGTKIGRKIITKYLGNTKNDLGKFLLGRLKEGKETLLELVPRYYSVWDDSKSP